MECELGVLQRGRILDLGAVSTLWTVEPRPKMVSGRHGLFPEFLVSCQTQARRLSLIGRLFSLKHLGKRGERERTRGEMEVKQRPRGARAAELDDYPMELHLCVLCIDSCILRTVYSTEVVRRPSPDSAR
jgi:hypothetical protein